MAVALNDNNEKANFYKDYEPVTLDTGAIYTGEWLGKTRNGWGK
jgi:hypothetical protein